MIVGAAIGSGTLAGGAVFWWLGKVPALAELKPVTKEEKALKPRFEHVLFPHPDDEDASADALWTQRSWETDTAWRRSLSKPETIAMLNMVRSETAQGIVEAGVCEDMEGAYEGKVVAKSAVEAAWLPPHVRVVRNPPKMGFF